MTGLPLLAAGAGEAAPVAWRAGVPITRQRFLADVAVQAESLPAGAMLLNLCGDRYRFTVGLAAALVRGATSLMPPNTLPETLDRLRGEHPGLYALADDPALDVGGLPRVAAVGAAGDGAAPSMPRIAADAVAACLLTSGSTGVPQPHAKTWGSLAANVDAAAARLASLLGRDGLHGLAIVATVPPQHMYGFESSVLLAVRAGAAFDAGRPFYPADIAAALARVPAPRALVTTPFHLKALLGAGVACPPVALVLSATAPLSPQLAAQAERALGGVLIEIYGCTEAGQIATRRTAETDQWQAMGALRLHAEPDGTGGERFVVEGGHVPPTPLADVLQLDDPQRFRLLGRANDLIHVAGKRTSLGHLNFHLNSIDGVDDGAFWLPPDVADGIVRPVAFVVAPRRSAPEIVAALRTRLEPVFVPRRVVHVDALPREATGKLTVAALEAFARRHLRSGGGA